jgi:hypothetical protein
MFVFLFYVEAMYVQQYHPFTLDIFLFRFCCWDVVI